MKFTRAIVRPPPTTFAKGLTKANEGPPNLTLALMEHLAYCLALSECGLDLTSLPEDPRCPDSCFVEDPAIVTARGAIATRPGAPSRIGEVKSIVDALHAWYPKIPRLKPPARLDGGDVCEADGHFLIGLSGRTNKEGARQLAGLLGDLGYRASTVDLRDNRKILHLKTGMTYIGDGRMLVCREMPRTPALTAYELIPVDDDEYYAANCVRINDRILIAAGYPKTAAALTDLGYELLPLEMSEFRKMDGSLTCLSLRF